MTARQVWRTIGLATLTVAAAAALGALVVRDQISRHRRDLFSSHPLRRLAALGYLAGEDASIDAVQLLRDFIAWEPRPILRRRAVQLLTRMERQLVQATAAPDGIAG